MLMLRSICCLVFLFFSSQLYAESINATKTSKLPGSELIKSKFNLVNHLGKKVTEEDFKGKFQMVFFGFTYCKKICPQGLNKMNAVLEALGTTKPEIVPIFISIDPKHDTTERLATFVKSYNAKFIGLTGEQAEIDKTVQSFRAYYGKQAGESPSDINFDHTSLLYLMDQDGNYLAHYASYLKTEKIVESVKSFLN